MRSGGFSVPQNKSFKYLEGLFSVIKFFRNCFLNNHDSLTEKASAAFRHSEKGYALKYEKFYPFMTAAILVFLAVVWSLTSCKSRLFNNSNPKENLNSDLFSLKISETEMKLLKDKGLDEFAQCAAELGALSDFSCGENDLDMSPEKKVPELVDRPYTRSVEQFVGHIGIFTNGTYKPLKNAGRCLNPKQLNHDALCFPNSRVGTLPSTDRNGKLMPHIKTGFICRRNENKPKVPFVGYADIAVVQTDSKTGRTCFYQYYGTSTAEKIPSPFRWESLEKLTSSNSVLSEEGLKELSISRKAFAGGGSQCTACHDSDPILHTRHVESVLIDDKEVGRPVLPKIRWGLASDYSVINYPGEISRHIFVYRNPSESDGRELCSSCHKMGENTCNKLLNNKSASQWFGSFLEEHNQLPADKVALGLDAIKACCSQAPKSQERRISLEYTAMTKSGISMTCGKQSLPLNTSAQIK